jgi:alginate O-acetyltransferase complex protein AlgI
MALVSFEYLSFVLALLVLYFKLSRAGQNVLLLGSSLGLCAFADVRSVGLLLGATFLDFSIGKRLAWEAPESERRRYLWLSVFLDVLVLVAFKYSEVTVRFVFHGTAHLAPAHPFVPIGISFYTLARVTHTLDVYFRLMRPCTSFLDFALFASFFPTLTSGPIERARTFLPQLAPRREFDLSRSYGALWLILLGLFKKVYVADTCAGMVKDFLDWEDNPNGAETLLGIYAYALQLYGDFAGYSDMARGVARLFGIDITQNFLAPYLATSIADYWKRWHVSLSSFLDDYVFVPSTMALRDYGTWGIVGATWVTFFVSGLWHGTGWTFLVWGGIHAAGLSVYALTRRFRKKLKKRVPARALAVVATLVTFHYVCFGYVFFRADDVSNAIATLSHLGHPYAMTQKITDSWLALLVLAALLFLLDGLAWKKANVFWVFFEPVWVRAVFYGVLLFCVVRFHAPAEAFVYAQF